MGQKIKTLFLRLKEWRPLATRWDRCAHTFSSVILLAPIVPFFL